MALSELLTLNSYKLTDDGRVFQRSRDERASSIDLSNGKIKKYVKAEKNTFDISWMWLPGLDLNSDGGIGRNTLFTLQSSIFQDFVFTVNDLDLGLQTYDVFITSYSEDLLRRDFILNTAFYDVKLQLRQV